MPDEQPKTMLVEWNLRGFPEDLRAACQKIALDERSQTGKRPRDADVVAKLLRQALGLPEPQQNSHSNADNATAKPKVKARRK